MGDREKLDLRVHQATKLAVLIKAYRAGVFRARNDEERALLGRVDALLNRSDEPSRPPRPGHLEPLSDRDYINAFGALQERVDLLEDAWQRGLGVATTPEQRKALEEVTRVLAPHSDA